jgi:hypothetical protein
VFFEPDSTWTEPLNRGSLFRLLKAKGVIIVVLNHHDAIPVILPEVCHPNTLVSFAETIADHLQYADYALATSAGVERDYAKSRGASSAARSPRVIRRGADFETLAAEAGGDGESDASAAFATTFPKLAGLRFLLSVGTINHALLLAAFDRLEAPDAGLVIVGREGWMSDDFLAAFTSHPAHGERLFWYTALDDQALVTLYRQAYASATLPLRRLRAPSGGGAGAGLRHHRFRRGLITGSGGRSRRDLPQRRRRGAVFHSRPPLSRPMRCSRPRRRASGRLPGARLAGA